MTVRRTTDWLPAAAYLYTLHLDGPSLAWEYLRRNPDYRRDWCGYRLRPTGSPSQHWGLRLYEDPEHDALRLQPDWLLDPDSLVPLRADRDSPEDTQQFKLWHIPGRKVLVHDSRRLVLTTYVGHQVVRMAIDPKLEHGMPYAYAVRPGAQASQRWRAIEAQLVTLGAETVGAAVPRPNRTGLAHMRSLQALDGARAGASQREIAQALFGEHEIGPRWHADSELRAQVRHLLRRGHAYVAGDYRRLLQPTAAASGDERRTAESP